jgi:carbon storage regulator
MLILTRRPVETIYIGEEVTVTVLGVVGNQVRFGIEAPRHIVIDRAEIHERKRRAAALANGQEANGNVAPPYEGPPPLPPLDAPPPVRAPMPSPRVEVRRTVRAAAPAPTPPPAVPTPATTGTLKLNRERERERREVLERAGVSEPQTPPMGRHSNW